jgi:DNA-binding winged helix-turn-helix (wHTH) protein
VFGRVVNALIPWIVNMRSSRTDGDKSRPDSFAVGEWTVSPARNLLVRGDEQVRVEPRVMDVLVCLAEHGDQLVSKEDLMEGVWKGRCVTDDVLTVTIYALRKALGDGARRPRYIETVSRRGYRLIAPVGAVTAATASTPIQADAPMPPEVRSRRYSWRPVAATLVLVLFAAGTIWTLAFARHRRHVPSAEAHEAWLKGRYFLDQRSIRGWQQALEQFERAVALDPV